MYTGTRYMKAKGQLNQSPNRNCWPITQSFGGLAERSNATGLQPADGGSIIVQGFESLTRRQFSSPVKAGTSTGEMNRTAEAARFAKSSIRLLAVKLNRRFHSDMPLMQNRNGQSW